MSIDSGTGPGTVIGPFGAGGVFAGAFSPGGVSYTVTGTYSNDTYLATVNLTTGQATSVAPVANQDIDLLQFSPSGLLYASEGFWLYRMDPAIMGIAFDAGGHLFATTYCAANSPFYQVELVNSSVGIEALSGIPHPHGGDISRVPEPGTFIVLGSGLIVAGALRRIRRRVRHEEESHPAN